MAKKKKGPADARMVMEETMADINRLIKDKDFASIDELNNYVNNMMEAGDIPVVKDDMTPLEKAQQIIYQAYGTVGKERVKLARQALEISADCADAYVILADDAGTDIEKAKGFFEQGVEIGRAHV